MTQDKMIFSVLSENKPGVLLRLINLISRRGFNIDSIVACDTESPERSRITLVVTGDQALFTQLVRQLLKLEPVLRVEAFDTASCAYSELLLIKVTVDAQHRLLQTLQAFGSRVIDIGEQTLTAEMSGPSDVIDRFVAQLEPFGIVEMTRTGVTALRRGDQPLSVTE